MARGKKTGGREKGTPNRLTGEARQIFKEIMEGEIVTIKSALDEVREKDVAKYLDVLAKLMPYYMPKQVDLMLSDSPILINVGYGTKNESP